MKKNGTLVGSKGTTVEVKIVNGSGKGEGKEFINLIFSKKPSEAVRNSMKLHRFRYYSVDSTWSAYKTDRALDFAYSLIKENKNAEPQKPEKNKPQKSAKNKPQKSSSIEDRVSNLENNLDTVNEKLDKLLALLDK